VGSPGAVASEEGLGSDAVDFHAIQDGQAYLGEQAEA
jgi:hypothetical protein